MRWGEDGKGGFEISLVLCQTRYDFLDLAEFTMCGQKEPDAGHSAEIKMYMK